MNLPPGDIQTHSGTPAACVIGWVDGEDGKPEVEMRPAGAWQPHMQGIGEASPK